MTVETFYQTLKQRFLSLLEANQLGDDRLLVTCRALTPDEAIGNTKRQDFPILAGKDIMIQAQFRNSYGQAFTDAPTTFDGSLREVMELDIIHDSHSRSLLIAALNAVMCHLGRCRGTVHCRTEGPELCAQDMHTFLCNNYPDIERIALIGYQPALLDMLSHSNYQVRVLDLNPANVGQQRYGILVEDGRLAYHEVVHHFAQLVLCTGSTVCNGTIVDYLDIAPEVLFFGTTLAGTAELMGLKRVCFADSYA
ncbi:MAG: Rossmann-like domain-containing protein [Lawsonibacter sp.]|jgi:uncharacterized protein (DUF4213/DUF364 family)